MGTRKLSGRMNVPFRPAGIRLSGKRGLLFINPTLQMVSAPAGVTGGRLNRVLQGTHTDCAGACHAEKKLGHVVICQFQMGSQLCFLHKKAFLSKMG